jgi:hypothetical protein
MLRRILCKVHYPEAAMIRISTDHSTGPAGCEPDASNPPEQNGGSASPSPAASLPLQVLAQASPRRPTSRQRTTSPDGDSGIEDLFAKTEKRARRQGFVSPRPTAISSEETPRAASGSEAQRHSLDQPAAVLDLISRAMLTGALKGTDKFRKMPEPERDHIFKMLEANDLPGLAAVAGNPLRSFSTGLKVGKQLLEKRGVENLPPSLHEPLRRLAAFYERNPQLVALGDAQAFSPQRKRRAATPERVRSGRRIAGRS